ncbi:MAG: hypothetical protein ACKOHK_14210, partial [Planctomycetia bacterium]
MTAAATGPAGKTLRLAVLLSGSGRTLENLLDWIDAGRLAARVVTVVSSRPDVRGVRIITSSRSMTASPPPASGIVVR